jgi:hypothetical protein
VTLSDATIGEILTDASVFDARPSPSDVEERSGEYAARLIPVAAGLGCPKSAIDQYPLVLMPSPRFRIEARFCDETPCIVVHQGFLTLLSFAMEVDILAERYGRSLPDTRQDLLWLKQLLFARYLITPFTLPALRSTLQDRDSRAQFVHLLATAETFAILHEAAHINLGHLAAASKHVQPADAPGMDFIEAELAADREAARQLGGAFDVFRWGAVNFLSQLNLYEMLTQAGSEAHPAAWCRIQALEGEDAASKDDPVSDTERTAARVAGLARHETLAQVHPYELVIAMIGTVEALVDEGAKAKRASTRKGLVGRRVWNFATSLLRRPR